MEAFAIVLVIMIAASVLLVFSILSYEDVDELNRNAEECHRENIKRNATNECQYCGATEQILGLGFTRAEKRQLRCGGCSAPRGYKSYPVRMVLR